MGEPVTHFETFDLKTRRENAFYIITPAVTDILRSSGAVEGTCTVYVPHTTAGVTINEAADPSVRRDIAMELDSIVPFDDEYTHGEGNSAAHIKASLTGSSVVVPIHQQRLTLGTWQGIYFCEFDGPRTRSVYVQISGTA